MLRRNSDDQYNQLPVPVEDVSAAAPQRHVADLRELVRILRRRWPTVLAFPLVLVVLAGVFVMIVTPLYTATSTVFIDPHRATAAETNNQAPPSNAVTDDATIESQVLLIQSIAILQRVVDRLQLIHDPEFIPKPGLLDPIKALFATHVPGDGVSPEQIARDNAVDFLKKRLKVTRQGTTFLIDINVSSEKPRKAATIANAIADAYFMEQVRSKYDATKIAADWLDKQIADLKSRVLASDKAVEEFRAANNLTVSQGVTLNDQQITDLNNKLVDARAETAQARAKLDHVQKVAKSGGDAGAFDDALSSDVIAHLRAQYAEVAKNYADLSSRYGPRHPRVADVRAQLQDTQRQINAEVKRILEGTRNAYAVAKSREESLQKSLDALQGVSTDAGPAQVRLRELQREAEANRTIYESFLARYKETSARESLEMPDSRVVTRAGIPLSPSFPKKLLIVGLAGMLGLGFGCVLALLVDYLDRRVKTIEQAEAICGLPAIAAIPLISTRELARMAKQGRWELDHYDPRTVRLLPPALQPPLMRYAIEEPTSTFAEAVRAVRLALLRASRREPSRVVMVASSIDGECKTTLAVNLALSLAVLGIRTIVVEGDLRNPQLTRSLCPRTTGGLFEVALGRLPLHQAVLVEDETGLAVLPCPLPHNITGLTEFVSADGMTAIFRELRRHFEVIVVDSPPLAPLVDGRALAELADHIIFAIGWDQTPQDVVVHALDTLGPVYDRILGTVLTRVDLRRLRLYDYYRSSAYIKPYEYGEEAMQEAAE
ncbi:MAG TPA: polysaccharide biosynthesis tyrosine autokinase [Xanthobacteraceae bacterium]|jgi:exopolysaccharide transport family protein